jgi:adenylate cyclase
LLQRLFQFLSIGRNQGDSVQELVETIEMLKKNIQAKNDANITLEKTNAELREAKIQLDEYAHELELKVEERTADLRAAQQDLQQLNQELEQKVEDQLIQLKRYSELRRYLSPKLTEKILADGHEFGAEPKRKMMTVVFSDIRGFSDFTDNVEPEELFLLLDRYVAEMIKIVHQYDGTLNKIVGDGLLVFFGDPFPMDDHVERAINMAVDMRQKVKDLRDEWRQFGHELGIGIGINTGFMTVGNMGSDSHRDYTVIGKQVNVAARLESLAAAGQILVSQRTYGKVKGLIRADEIGEVTVKGIHNPIKTYNVIDFKSDFQSHS